MIKKELDIIKKLENLNKKLFESSAQQFLKREGAQEIIEMKAVLPHFITVEVDKTTRRQL